MKQYTIIVTDIIYIKIDVYVGGTINDFVRKNKRLLAKEFIIQLSKDLKINKGNRDLLTINKIDGSAIIYLSSFPDEYTFVNSYVTILQKYITKLLDILQDEEFKKKLNFELDKIDDTNVKSKLSNVNTDLGFSLFNNLLQESIKVMNISISKKDI